MLSFIEDDHPFPSHYEVTNIRWQIYMYIRLIFFFLYKDYHPGENLALKLQGREFGRSQVSRLFKGLIDL